MRRTALFLLAVLAAPVIGQDTQEKFFGLDKIWDIHIEVTRADWKRMYPKGGRTPTRLFGRYPYRPGRVTIGSHVLKDVHIRMKGNATFAAHGGTLKKSLKIDFNRGDPERNFLGMGKLNLQCNALDGTQIKEAVSYHVYRACGIVAGRTCFARVYLTLTGKTPAEGLDRVYLGLYTVVEQVDQRFAKRTMGGGLILKPDGETLAYLGEKWNADYAAAYHPKSPVRDALVQPLIRTAALFDEPDDAVFAKGIEAVMDLESFLKYTAATAILINTDSPLTVPDNYYLIVSKQTGKVTWVPWDMNWSMGEYGRVTDTPSLHLRVLQPTEKEVFRRVLSIPRFQKRYREIVTKFIAGPCSAKAMTAAIRLAHGTVAGALAAEAKRPAAVTAAGEELGGRRLRHPMLRVREDDHVAGLEAFVAAREKSVRSQLAGTTEGKPARNLWGTNARTVRGAWVRDALGGSGVFAAAQDSFDREEMATAWAAGFARLDLDQSGTLDAAELTAVLRRQWAATPRRSRRGPDPSADRAGRVLASLDRGADGSVDRDEWEQGILGLLRFWDRNCDGRWSRSELNLATKPG